MFLLNSCLGLFSATKFTLAPLLPKLRGQFAEFLNNASLAHLRIFSSSTRVGLRYGYYIQFLQPFLASVFLDNSLLFFTISFDTSFSSSSLIFHSCVSYSFSIYRSAGISTYCPSDTLFGLSLGPDLPWADEPSPGNLRLSMA